MLLYCTLIGLDFSQLVVEFCQAFMPEQIEFMTKDTPKRLMLKRADIWATVLVCQGVNFVVYVFAATLATYRKLPGSFADRVGRIVN